MPASLDAPVQFLGRLAVQQRVLPAYRAAFFDILAQRCQGGLSVFAGQPQPDEQIPAAQGMQAAEWVQARNRNLFKIGSPLYRCWQPGLTAWLERFQPDVLVVEANPRYRSTPAAIRWMHARRRPVLGWGLGAPPLSGRLAAWRTGGRRRLLSQLDGMIAYSRSGANEYVRMGFAPERVFIAPNAAAARPTSPPPERSPLAGPATLLFVGRLQSRKRIDSLLRACAALPAALRPQVCIVGDGPARGEFEAVARQVYPQAEFAGARYGDDLEGYFARADLFVLPGTGGLAVQQAMAYALPVIVAEGDGTQSDLVRPHNGWVIPSDDLTALTAALANALADGERLRRMGAESYRIVSEEINLEAMANYFVQAANRVRIA